MGGEVAEVVIAGGGVAGATAAIMLGRAGVAVDLYEQRTLPQEKACAEGLMPAGVGVLERLGLRAALTGRPFRGVRYEGWGRSAFSPFPTAPGVPSHGLGERRLRFDVALLDAARATPGVRVFEGARVDDALVEAGRVRGLIVGGDVRRARLTIGADGPRSPVRRALGLERRPAARGGRIGVRAHFRLAPGQLPPDVVEVYLGDGHELYMTPLPGDEVVVAALGPRGAAVDKLDLRFARWRAQHKRLAGRLEGAVQVSALAGRSPLVVAARAGVAPGLALVGDAAGPVDPVTGSGMAQALLSAERLAMRVAPALTSPARPRFDPGEDAVAAFDRERRVLLRDGRLLTGFVLALVHRPTLARGMMRLLGKSPTLFSHLLGVAAQAQPLVPL